MCAVAWELQCSNTSMRIIFFLSCDAMSRWWVWLLQFTHFKVYRVVFSFLSLAMWFWFWPFLEEPRVWEIVASPLAASSRRILNLQSWLNLILRQLASKTPRPPFLILHFPLTPRHESSSERWSGHFTNSTYTPLSLVCIILRSNLVYRVYLTGCVAGRRKWLHWLVS